MDPTAEFVDKTVYYVENQFGKNVYINIYVNIVIKVYIRN